MAHDHCMTAGGSAQTLEIMSLPVEDIVADFLAVLRGGKNAVVQAPPGAGKSTLLPLKLLDQDWLAGRRVLMLEPRRLAARMVAKRLAQNFGQELGRTIGFRVRDEARVSKETRLEVVTEGILTRLLQDDPELSGVGIILFDEFHERSLQADLGLALALDVQASLRPDLRLVAMSATLDGQAVSALLGDAPILTSDGRLFAVETRYLPLSGGATMEASMTQAVRQALRENEGDVLAFLPGAGEIRRVERLLNEASLSADVLPLYGELSAAEQDRAVSPGGVRRRVVLATSIAETSLTIEGVRVVVDAGLARRPSFDPRSGMTRLETVKASLASADQRRGRAGRLGPGVAYRLWPEAENRARPAADRPEIESADLASLALDLAQWGVSDPARLRWVNPPPASNFAQAAELLRELEALDAQGRITEHGKQLARLPVHPRLAHMIARGREIGAGVTACRIAALLEERDVLRARPGQRAADIRLRLEALQALEAGRRFSHFELSLNEGSARRALRLASRLMRVAGVRDSDDAGMAGLLLGFAYPDRIARRRTGDEPRYRLANGRGAVLEKADSLAGEKFIAIADLDGAGAEGRIYMAGAVDEADLRQHFATHIETRDSVEWDEQQQRVLAARQERLGALVLSEKRLANPSTEAVQAALLQAVRQRGLASLAFDETVEALRQRVATLRIAYGEDWPDLSDAALLARLEDWLLPEKAMSLNALRQLDHATAIRNLLQWEQQRALDRLAPTHIEVPSGSRVRIDYSDPAKPVLAVKLQEMFGLAQTPAIADGRVPLSLHLLSPAGRPLQVTGDLAGFWRSSYAEVRKEMRGRYPRHPWPEDPLTAPPTARAKRRGT